MQLFLVSPLLFWVLWKWKKIGIMMLIAAAIWSTVLRFNVMYYNDYSVSFHFGARWVLYGLLISHHFLRYLVNKKKENLKFYLFINYPLIRHIDSLNGL